MKYHFFWGGIYSNWYKAPFTMEFHDLKLEFNCAEQYMMYAKAVLSYDQESMEAIMKTKNPKEQKKLGRAVKNFNSADWDFYKKNLMTLAIEQKFIQNPELMKQLLEEDCEEFVEASPYDRIWGIGYPADVAEVHVKTWGENLLGKILTEIRNKHRRARG